MIVMVAFVIAVILLALALLAVTLQKAYFYVPVKELHHRASRGDHVSAALATVAVYGSDAQLLLVSVVVATATLGIVLFAQPAPLLLGLAVVAVVLALGFFWQPRTRLTRAEAGLAVWCAPAVVWLARHLQIVLRPFTSWAEGRRLYQRHTKLFDAADLETLLDRQRRQRDNRIGGTEMDRLRRALRFGHIRVREAMTPRAKVKMVDAADLLSPVLVDELHQTGHVRFPVYEGTKSNIIGALPLDVVADVKLHGTVADNADHKLAYVHEQDSLEEALKAFYETRQHLFVVLDARGNYVGILTLSDILQELAGGLNEHKFGRFDDREAVASRHRKEEMTSENKTEVIE